jgi:CBS domain-containing protein
VVDDEGHLIGVLTRRDLAEPALDVKQRMHQLLRRPPIVVYDDLSLREAADHMINHDVGRLPVIERANPHRLIGMITRSDLLSAHRRRLDDMKRARAMRLFAGVKREASA